MALLAAVYFLICAGCASFQRKFIYFPPVFDAATADKMGASAHLERWKSESGASLGWKRLSPVQPAAGCVLVVHGNAGSAVECGHYADAIQKAAPLDIFIVEFPGYADRPGKPTENSLEAAASEALVQLTNRATVYVLGESLGTGVAAYLAGAFPGRVSGLVLIAPYSSLTDVAQFHMPLLPVPLILVDRFPADKFLRNYHGPVAMLVGGADQVVPMKFGRRLFDGYNGQKRLWEFPKDDHGDLMVKAPELWSEIIRFWQTNAPAH